jgi:ABC-type polysaccharide/polyol phosphate export permease
MRAVGRGITVHSPAAVAAQDLTGSILRLPLAFALALDDVYAKYRRTVLGPLWIVIGQAATVAGFVVVFSGLFQMDPRVYALYLAAGFPVWALLSSYLSDMPLTFINARGMMESYELPWLMHIWRRSIGYVLVFAHQLVTLFAVMAMMGVAPRPEMLLIVPALAVLMLAGSGLGLLLALFGARYRDLQPAMVVVSSFLFLFSPVVWRAEQLQVNEWAVQFNPVYYFLKLLRDPLMGQAPSPELWLGTSVAALVIFAIGFLAFYVCRRRLYHWL